MKGGHSVVKYIPIKIITKKSENVPEFFKLSKINSSLHLFQDSSTIDTFHMFFNKEISELIKRVNKSYAELRRNRKNTRRSFEIKICAYAIKEHCVQEILIRLLFLWSYMKTMVIHDNQSSRTVMPNRKEMSEHYLLTDQRHQLLTVNKSIYMCRP